MGTVKTLLTFEAFEQFPDHTGKQELVRGELIEMPPADLKHNRISHRIFKSLDIALEDAHARGEAAELAEVYLETGYLVSDDCWLVPDVGVTHAGQKEAKYLMGAPAIAIEVISASNTVKRIDAKAALYFEFGAREVWRFLPKTRQVMIQIPGGVRTLSAEDFITTPLLPGLSLSVAKIFAI